MGANCLPIHSQNGRSTKVPHSAASNRRKRARSIRKVQPLRVPPGKIIKAQAMLIEGHSMREVSRNLHMSAHTVAKVVRTEDFVRHIKKMQERLFAFAPDALTSFHNQLKMDGHLAYVFLKDLGIIPSPEAMAQFLNAATPQTETGEERQARMLACVLLEARNNYGLEDFDFDTARDSEHQKAQTSQPSLLRK
jgi:hypothetical protein